MQKIPFDFHTHTLFSPDGESGAEEMLERAAALGMECCAVTDHVEINQFYDLDFSYESTVRRASEQIPALKERYRGRLRVLYGVELGQPLHDPALSRRVLQTHPYDFVIGSCHMLRGHEDFYFLDYQRNDPRLLLDLYFEELLEMARKADFDVLGHLTYPLRYMEGDQGISIDMSRYKDRIDEIFRTLIRGGKGIEINTSGLRQKIGRLLPDQAYIRRYRELGGEILTIGSDAHRAEDLGKNIAEGIAAAVRAGFEQITCFSGRKPEFIPIRKEML